MRKSSLRPGWIRAAIICAMAVVLAACSALRVAYNTGPQLAWWWLDSYLDFSRQQAPQVKAAIDKWFEWHRGTQITDYAALLAQTQRDVLEPTTPAAMCSLSARVGELVAPAFTQALQQAVDLVPGLGEPQLRHLEQRYQKNLDEMRREYLQTDAAERLQASIKRTIERAEQLYGRLDDAQHRVIAEGVMASPFDPDGWREERIRRQRDTLQTLRRLLAEKADRDDRLAALRMLAERSQRSPDPAYRTYQQRLTDYNCAFVARIHNATTLEQRKRAREKLKDWEDDLRTLVNGANSG